MGLLFEGGSKHNFSKKKEPANSAPPFLATTRCCAWSEWWEGAMPIEDEWDMTERGQSVGIRVVTINAAKKLLEVESVHTDFSGDGTPTTTAYTYYDHIVAYTQEFDCDVVIINEPGRHMS